MNAAAGDGGDLRQVVAELTRERDAARAEAAASAAELTESGRYQAAISEVLDIISRPTTDIQPVLDRLVEIAAQLCDAEMTVINRRDTRVAWVAASHGYPEPLCAYWRAVGPIPLDPDSPVVAMRTLIEGRVVHVHDVAAVPDYPTPNIELGGLRTIVGAPLLRGDEIIGMIGLARQRVEPFTERQIALLRNFAAQAVIAMENARLINDQREALEQQTATAEVVQAINASPGDLAPVFQTMLDRGLRLCGAAFGELTRMDGDVSTTVAVAGMPAAFSRVRVGSSARHGPGTIGWRLRHGENFVHVTDLVDTDLYRDGDPVRRALVDDGGARALLVVPLRKDDALIGMIAINRQEPGAFTGKQIALLENFAAQAVIAMENARLLTDQREALERQTATADVLAVINASPGDLAPVFKVILEKAHQTCDSSIGALSTFDGSYFRVVALHGYPPEYAEIARQPRPPRFGTSALLGGERYFEIRDFRETLSEFDETAQGMARFLIDFGVRTMLYMPLRKDGTLLGYITANRTELRAFSDKEIALLENFAAQAVIAMDNARLLSEIRQRQSELNITFENMGDGVAMFDREQKLAAWNRNFQDILDLPDGAVRIGLPFADYIRELAENGEYGPDADADEQIARLTALLDQANRFERTRPNGRVIDIRQNPIPGGGFVIIYADITERKRAEEALRAARDEAETALRELKLAQANLVQAEKMASLGQLTAGIAHEIKNPLNFVNNFASLSVELLDELKETAGPALATLSNDSRADIEDIEATLTSNLEKIVEHGRRADRIVVSMLEHSRGASGERRMVDINTLADEALNLAYHGARAQDQSFNITLERDFAEDLAPIELNPQDMTRVLLNLFSNGFYAAHKRASDGPAAFAPALRLTTRDAGNAVEVRVRDNGTGIPADIRDKLFQPFFTTKPTGEGTGLGLSITYDIVTKQHGGTIAVDSEIGDHTEFTVTLPRRSIRSEGDRS